MARHNSYQRRAAALIRRARLRGAKSTPEAVELVGRYLGREIHVESERLGAGMWGCVVDLDPRLPVVIVWNPDTVMSDRHRDHVVHHELGHLVAGDDATNCHAQATLETPAEQAAEAFAAALHETIASHGDVASRLSGSLC